MTGDRRLHRATVSLSGRRLTGIERHARHSLSIGSKACGYEAIQSGHGPCAPAGRGVFTRAGRAETAIETVLQPNLDADHPGWV